MSEQSGKHMPKSDWKKKSPRISNSQKINIAKQYDKRLENESSISILTHLTKKYGKDVRTIQRYIQKGRELIADSKPESTISENSPLLDQNTIKALKQHLTEIGNAIEKIKHILTIPPIYELTEDTFAEVAKLESEPLFECLKEHLPSDDFWNKVSEYRRLFEQYWEYRGQLYFDYTEEEKKWQGKIVKLEDFTTPILYRIERASLWWSKQVLAVNHRFARQDKHLKQKDVDYSTSEILIADGYKVLEADEVTEFIGLYKLMSDRILNEEVTKNVIKLHDQLRPISNNIDNYLGKFLFNRKYLMRSCYLCRELKYK